MHCWVFHKKQNNTNTYNIPLIIASSTWMQVWDSDFMGMDFLGEVQRSWGSAVGELGVWVKESRLEFVEGL